MPLKLVAPRKGKSPNFTIRGSYLGVAVNKSSGTHKRSIARTVLANLERAIESGEWPPKPPAGNDERTFLSAAVEYLEAGEASALCLPPHQAFRCDTAHTDRPSCDRQGSHRAHCRLQHQARAMPRLHAGLGDPPPCRRRSEAPAPERGQRPCCDGLVASGGRPRIIQAADAIDAEFALLLRFLLFTGLRLGEVSHSAGRISNSKAAPFGSRGRKAALPQTSTCVTTSAIGWRCTDRRSLTGAFFASTRAET